MEPQENSTEQEETKSRSAQILQWALILAIIIILNLFFAFSIKLVYDAPEFEDFCPIEQVEKRPQTQDECVARGGQWTEYPKTPREVLPEERPVPIDIEETREPTGYCDTEFTCRQEYEDVRDVYSRNVFIVWVILGVISIVVASTFLGAIYSVSLGLSLGGVISLVVGTIQYWSAMDDILRVIILGIALVALIYLGVKKFKE